tara:strand:- start:44 stop:2944 length:2901 start_codon:yes stop_codon:yes gene_type:complete
MSRIEKYANWITENQDKKGTEDFEKVANAYKALRSQKSEPSEKSFRDMLSEREVADEDADFDYETGATGGLRALVSFGETEEEKEAILLKKVGKDGYTKDSKGRLALTPIGQKKVGMQPSDKNVVLEEKGFSARDFADMAGVVPETVGSVVGGILGIPGGVFGSAAGAGAGAAVGQAAEEGIEALLGVQKQTLPEIGKDLAKEAALAGTVDLVTLGTFRVAKGLVGAGAKRLAGDPLDAARGADLVRRGFKPSLERLGAPSPLAYSQKFAEGATRDYQRIVANTNLAIQEKEALLKNLADLDAAGQSFANVAGPKYKKLSDDLEKARQSSLKAVKDSVDILEKGVKSDLDIDDFAINSMIKSFKNFQDVADINYTKLDDALTNLDGMVRGSGTFAGDVRFIDAGKLNALTNNIMDRVANIRNPDLLEPQLAAAIKKVKALKVGEDTYKATFTQLSSQRKIINDTLYYGTADLSSEGRKQLGNLLDEFDTLLSADHLAASAKGVGGLENIIKNNPQIKNQLEEIGKLRDKAAGFYRDGKKPFDDLEKFGVIRDMRQSYNTNGKFNTDKFFDKIIKSNSPQRLNSVLNSMTKMEKGRLVVDKTAQEQLRSQLAKSYLNDALGKTNLDLFNPKMFNGKAFRNHINNLGTTGKVLFGKQWDEVQKLADTIGQVSLTNIDDAALQNILKANANKGITDSLQDLARASKEFQEANSISIVKKFNDGTLTAEDAAREMIRTNITSSEVGRLQKFFSGNQTELNKIKEAVVSDLFRSVGDDIFTSPAKSRALLDAMNRYRPGVLKKIIGDDHYKVVEQFAKDLTFLGDVGKEGSIYAATFAAHPIAKLPANVRMKGMARLFASPTVLNFFAKTGTPNQRLTRTMDILGTVTGAIARTTAGTRQLGAQAAAEQIGETNQEIQRSFTPVPNVNAPVQSSSIGGINVTQPQPNLATNPIVNPNPTTQALAKQLQGNI